MLAFLQSRPKAARQPADISLNPEAAPALVAYTHSLNIVKGCPALQICAAVERKSCPVTDSPRYPLRLIGEVNPAAGRIGKYLCLDALLLLQDGSGLRKLFVLLVRFNVAEHLMRMRMGTNRHATSVLVKPNIGHTGKRDRLGWGYLRTGRGSQGIEPIRSPRAGNLTRLTQSSL